ncbi:hypothetical protein N9J19_00660 [bacterium]|nr:hypothetical protein [bacterium]
MREEAEKLGIYIVKDLDAFEAGMIDPNNKDHYYVKYIGSSHLSIETLERNHRNCFEQYKGEKQTDFRHALVDRGSRWTFEWLIEPRETNEYTILIEEGACIRAYKSSLNNAHNWGQYPLLPKLKDINDRQFIA